MAAGMLPKPGTPLGPCDGECEHIDCAATREQAASACRLCHAEIGYDTRFYIDPENRSRYVHAACLSSVVWQGSVTA